MHVVVSGRAREFLAQRFENVHNIWGLTLAGLTAEIVTADIAKWNDARRFDAVLIDAPCSATGTFRRHPDVLWGSRPGDIASYLMLSETGAADWTPDPQRATTFSSMREAARMALRLPASTRAYGLPRQSEVSVH